jgi:NAD(P)-dependent dehydrogenase (short-subunit alcohol dehydrogenase family)
VAVVTGAGRGIGRATAERLASRGWDVAICARTSGAIESLADDLEARFRTKVVWTGASVTDADAMRTFATEVVERLRAPDLLVNNAGILGPVGPLAGLDLGRWSEAVAVNLVGVATVISAFAPSMLRSGRGSIINLAGGGVGGPSMNSGLSAYTASKAGVVALTETLAAELHPVRVNVVAPGAIATSFNDEILEMGPDEAGHELFELTTRQRSEPSDIGDFLDLVEWLSGPESNSLTGRFFAARWESPASLTASAERVSASAAMYRLRRVDGELITDVSSGNSG